MDVRFDIVKLSEATYEKLTSEKALSAFFDRTTLHDVNILPRVMAGDAAISGLTESHGLKGQWSIGITCWADLAESWQGFVAENAIMIDSARPGLFVAIDGGGLTAEAVLDAVAALTESIETAGEAEMALEVDGSVPVEIYYRPPLSYYDTFQLSAMDNDTLAQLERRLIE